MINPLKHRAEHLTEQMDRPDADKYKLFNTYRQFDQLNGLISRWESLFKAYIAPLAAPGKTVQILDIGCGGGDLCLKILKWARELEIRVQVTGIDPDPRAMEYLNDLDVPEQAEFRQAVSSDLIRYGENYDVVISNHLLHHLKRNEIGALCEEAAILARKLVIFNDIRRSGVGFTAFGLAAPLLYRSSFIYRDGLTSIRRSFTKTELLALLPYGWQVKKLFPYRLLVMLEKV